MVAIAGMQNHASRPARLVTVLLGLAVLVPAPVRGESTRSCKRACRDGIAACAAWRAPMKRRKAKRICARELLPVCAREGTVECERAPHYRGSYAFEGDLTDTTCSALPAGFPQGPASFWFTVHNRARDWIDVTIYAADVIEDSGVGTALPWSIGDERGNCLYGEANGDWCAGGKLTIYGLPPRHPKSPRPPATLSVVVSVYRPEPRECTRTYAGELQYLASE